MFSHLHRIGIVGTILVLAGMGSVVLGQGETVPAQTRRIIVGGDHNYPPYEFLDENGRPDGFNVDLVRAVAEAAGLEVEHKLGPWEESLQASKEGRINVLPMFRSKEREQFADFSDPFTILYHVVFIRRGSPGFSDIRDLAGKEVIVQRAACAHDCLRHECPGAKPIFVETEPDAMRLLASGKHHCALVTHVGGQSAIRRFDLRNITSGSPPLSPRHYCLAVRKGDTALLDLLNRGLKAVQSSGRYDQLHEKWLGELLSIEMNRRDVLNKALWVLGVIVLIGAFALLWLWPSRRQTFHIQIAVCYLIAGCLWILLSDALVAYCLPDPRHTAWAQVLKGWGYVAVTGLLLWFLVRHYMARSGAAARVIEESNAELARVNRALMVLSQCNQALIRAVDESHLLNEVCRIIAEKGGYRLAWIGLAEHDEEKTVRPVAQAGFEEGYLAAAGITWADTERGRGPTGTAIRTGKPYICRNIPTDPEFAPWREAAVKHGYASSIALPITASGQTLGALSIYAAEADAFDEKELGLLSELADDLAYGISALRTRVERNKAQGALDEAILRQKEAVRAANVGLWDWDLLANKVRFSAEWKRQIGYEEHEIGDDFEEWRSRVHPDDLAPTLERVKRSIAEVRQDHEVEFRFRHRNGAYRWILAQASVFPDEAGRPVRMLGSHVDITERKRAEEEIVLRARQQTVVAELGQYALRSADLSALLNEAVARAAETLQVEYCKVLELLPERNALLLRAGVGWKEGFVGNATVEAEAHSQAGYTLLSDKPVVVEDYQTEARFAAAPLLRDQGAVSGMSVIIQGYERPFGVLGAHTTKRRAFMPDDIHFLQAVANVLGAAIERRKAEEAYQTLVQRSPYGIALVQGGRIVFTNPAFAAMTGYSVEELLAMPPEGAGALKHPADRDRVLGYYKDHLKGKPAPSQYEYRLLRKDGTIRWMDVSVSVVEYQGQPAVQVFYNDITERKQAEETLEESEEKYRTLFEDSPDALSLTVKGKIAAVNPAWLKLHGFEDVQEVVGTDVMDIIHPDDRWILRERRNASPAQLSRGYEIRDIRKDGSTVHVEVFSSTISLAGEDAILSTIRDITERKRAEDALRKSEERLRMVMDGLGPHMFVGLMDTRGVVLVANRPALEAAALKPEEVVGKPVEDTYWWNYSETVRERLRAAVERAAKGEAVRYDEQIRAAEGQLIWLDFSIQPLRDETGQIAFLIPSGRVITEHKRAEDALRESNARLKKVLEVETVGVMFWDLTSGCLMDANDTFLNLMGYSRREVEARELTWQRLTPPEYMEASRAEIRKFQESGRVGPYEKEYLRKDGTRQWLVFAGSSLGSNACVEFCVDISDRKKAEAALRESEERFRVVFASSTDAVMLLDEDRFFDCNDATLQMFGCSRAEFLCKHPSEVSPPAQPDGRDSREAANERIAVALRDGRNFFEWTHRRADGRDFPAEVLLSAMTLGGRRVLQATVRDVTERKRTEEEKAKLQAQLIQAQKMEAVGTLAGGVAHDFNNMLTTILGFTEIGLMNVRETDPLFADLKRVLDAGQRAAGLVRQLLLFSRNQPMEFKPMDLNQTVTGLLKMIDRLIGEDVAVETRLAPDAWAVRGDPGTLEQVVMNLAVNARDAMPQGGRIAVSTENVEISPAQAERMAEGRAGRFVCLSVRDTGTGMDRRTLDHLFEPFFTTKGAGKGTGLGLSVVYGIVKQHGGWITVDSRVGEGSEFKVYLPAIAEAVEEKAEEKPSLDGLMGNGERILLVEDDPDVREFAAEVLARGGYVVLAAGSVKEALEVFEKEGGRFDLVVSDCVLPDGTGLQLVEDLTSRRPELRVVLGSGYTDDRSQWDVIRERGFVFVQKPYGIPTLLRAVREAIGKMY
ncbi:MAG: PAS domain S-box protein [Planctomycetota bacterium]